ncbi:MAG: sigma-70 family RNA polymerase sigma factor [Clostridia bacterium]|nr:sigma-70 family RNA polymerase sigma factor [Clostridia bacterium]MBR6780537.1 sigma-70 family RNA polymerase sigma factor [Clostridia bacterium]
MTQESFTDAVQRNSQRLYLIALSFVKNTHDAEDILQNVFLKLWKYPKPFSDSTHLDKWLTAVCVNESKNYIKLPFRKHQNVDDCVFDSSDSTDSAVKADLYRAVMQLSQKERTVIHLFYYEDLSVKDIAKMLKIKESAVKTRLSRARNKLKEQLGDAWNDE